MKQILALILSLGILSNVSYAHCGACGVGDKHEHTNKKETTSIIETAKAAGNFSTLLAAIDAAGLKGALSADGPLTVFAPTDDAFAALGEETIASLLKDKEKLASILTYHVIDGAISANDVTAKDKAVTLNGQSVPIKVNDGTVTVGNARVVVTDIVCANGVIHVIDAVMIPESGSDKG